MHWNPLKMSMSRSPISSNHSKRTQETSPSTAGSEHHLSKRQQTTSPYPKFKLPPQNLMKRNQGASAQSDGYGYRPYSDEDRESESLEGDDQWDMHSNSESSDGNMLPPSDQNRVHSPTVGDDNNDLEEEFDQGAPLFTQPEFQES